MSLIKRNAQFEEEYSLLSEMEMLQVYGGNGDIVINNPGCTLNLEAGCNGTGSGSGTGSGTGSAGPPVSSLRRYSSRV